MNIRRIINEEINKCIFEKKSEKKDYSKFKAVANDEDSETSDKDYGTDQFGAELEKRHDSGQLNYRKLAANMYGLSTSTKSPETTNKLNSLASALQKKIEKKEGASGGQFHLSTKEASKIAPKLV